MISLRSTVGQIKSDIKCHGGTNFKKTINIYLFNPSFRLLLNYRIGRYLKQKKGILRNFFVQWFEYRQVTKRNCYISYRAIIGNNFKLAHPIAVVIGEGVVIGDNVRIWQNVTLGSHGKKNSTFSYPEIGDNVKIFAGAKIFGGIKVGENAKIGANAVVNCNIPPNSIAVGIPARILDR